MRTSIISYSIILIVLGIQQGYCQDLLRINATHDFKSKKFVQTFSFDLNRTEKVDEKLDRAIYKDNQYYISPSVDANIGDGVNSSENNILVQLIFGKIIYGVKKRSDNLRTVSVWNKSMEINPTHNSDKLFVEKLTYGQVKFMFNFMSQTFTVPDSTSYLKFVHSIASGPFVNIGFRKSVIYDKSNFYNTAGIKLEYKTRIQNDKFEDDWVFKITGNYYYIAEDIPELTSDDFGGLIKASIDRKIFSTLLGGITYKYGNDNPNYKYVNTLEVGLKYKY